MIEHPQTVEIFRFLTQYIKEHGFAPSLREISSGCFVARTTVIRHLALLEAQGWIAREIYKARGITILKPLPDTAHLMKDKK